MYTWKFSKFSEIFQEFIFPTTLAAGPSTGQRPARTRPLLFPQVVAKARMKNVAKVRGRAQTYAYWRAGCSLVRCCWHCTADLFAGARGAPSSFTLISYDYRRVSQRYRACASAALPQLRSTIAVYICTRRSPSHMAGALLYRRGRVAKMVLASQFACAVIFASFLKLSEHFCAAPRFKSCFAQVLHDPL